METGDSNKLSAFLVELGVDHLQQLVAFPKYVQIETFHGCNARCVMCSVSSWARNKGPMPTPLFDKIVEELAQHRNSVERVIVQQDGEPLLDKALEKRIAALKLAGMRNVSFATNASLLTAVRSRSIIESGVDRIDFSVDGVSPEVFEQIRVNLSFEQTLQNILGFLSIRNEMKHRLPVRIRMAIQKSNAGQFAEFVKFWREVLSPEDTVFGKIEQDWINWNAELKGVPGFESATVGNPVNINILPCVSPFDSIVIFADGRVPLCCLDYNAETPMGDVTRSTIADVWSGDEFRRVRRMHLEQGRKSMTCCTDCHNYAESIKFSYPGLRSHI